MLQLNKELSTLSVKARPHFLDGWYISLTPSPRTTTMDYLNRRLNGLPKWITYMHGQSYWGQKRINLSKEK